MYLFITCLPFHNKVNERNIPRHVITYLLLNIRLYPDGHYNVRLLCFKTKVYPLTVLTILRLELHADLLRAQLMQQVLGAHSDVSNRPTHFWSDCQIVLCWLRKGPIQ